MHLEIHNYRSCSHLLDTQPGQWDVVVILDSALNESGFVKSRARRSLQVFFDDITSPSPNMIAPDTPQVSSAIDFGLTSSKFIVSCRAGQSRSAAIAFAVAYEKLGIANALSILDPEWHRPNERIIKIADGVINRPGIVDAHAEWKSNIDTPKKGHFLRMAEHIDATLNKLGARDRISTQDAV